MVHIYYIGTGMYACSWLCKLTYFHVIIAVNTVWKAKVFKGNHNDVTHAITGGGQGGATRFRVGGEL